MINFVTEAVNQTDFKLTEAVTNDQTDFNLVTFHKNN